MRVQLEFQVERGQWQPMAWIPAQFHRPFVSYQPTPDVASLDVGVTDVVVQIGHTRVGCQQWLQESDGFPGAAVVNQVVSLFENRLQLVRPLAMSARPLRRRCLTLSLTFTFTQD